MTFAAPWMLWSLLALLPLVAVYFLKVRPRRKPATAYFLWEKIFNERKSTRLLHRLRSLWSLLIMALAFAAIALALAEPRWSDAERADLLILIDNSASMQAEGPGGVRLELAKEKARDLARALDGVQRAAVATVADRLRYQSHLTDNPRELLAAIDKIEPTYEEFRVAALPKRKEFTAENAEDAEEDAEPEKDESGESESAPSDWTEKRRVLVVTDGVLDGANEDNPAPEAVELLLVGQSDDAPINFGLVAVDLQFVPGSADEMSFYFQVASTAEEAAEVDLLLSREDQAGVRQIAKVIPLSVEPGVNKPQVLTVEGAGPGRWVAELDGDAMADDALAADNTAWLVARRPPPIPIAVASDDRYFFEQSVRAFNNVRSALRLVDRQSGNDGAQVTLAKGGPEGARSIVFQPDGESPWWSGLKADDQAVYEVGAVKVVIEDHPVLRHIDPLSIAFVGARRLKAPAGAQVLVEADDGTPLIYAANRSEQAAVVVNLDPVAAEFYYSAWFPVLVHSAAKHLAGREAPLLAVYKPGDSVAFPQFGAEGFGETLAEAAIARGGSIPAREEDPEAFDKAVALSKTPAKVVVPLAEARLDRLSELGFYEVATAKGPLVVGASLLSEQETMIAANREAPPPPALASGGPPGGWFIALAILAATAESILYHRRKVG